MKMNFQDNEFSAIDNMGRAERGLRSLLGLGMIVTVLVLSSLSETLVAGLSMLSIYIMFTAITGWDPIYALTRKSRHHSTPIPPTATVRPRTTVNHSDNELKKAA
jgi:Inner membrane protein YgaP-like, transmembrane domain